MQIHDVCLFVEYTDGKLEFSFKKIAYSPVYDQHEWTQWILFWDLCCFFWQWFDGLDDFGFQFQRNASSDNSKACVSIWIVCVAMKSNHSLWSVRCSIVCLECNNHSVARGFRLEGSNYMCKKICVCMVGVNNHTIVQNTRKTNDSNEWFGDFNFLYFFFHSSISFVWFHKNRFHLWTNIEIIKFYFLPNTNCPNNRN